MPTNNSNLTKLDRAVIRQLGGSDYLADIANHGIGGGFPGFTYYSDTVKFFKAHRADIIALVKEMADDFGQSPMEFVAGFNCFKGMDFEAEIAECLYGRVSADNYTVPNALAWFAAEETARKLTDN